MPPRCFATNKITEHLLGGPVVWSYGEVRPQPMRAHSFAAREATSILDQTTWDRTEDYANELWEKIVNSMDWTRVLISATAEHLRRQETEGEENHPDHILVQEVCEDCVSFALLTKER
jgi:hypothetical protein